jgi:hypothetical protein
MLKIIKLFGIAVLFIGLMSCNKADQKTNSKETESKKVNTEEKKDATNKQTTSGKENSDAKTSVTNKSYSDLTEFWNDFKKFALAGDYDRITEMTYFPFLHQSSEMNKSEFREFRFTDTFLDGMKTKKAPKKSEMMLSGFKSGELYEVEYQGQAMYFAKVKDDWKFIGLLYGE